jgi:PST family polysaccharide transporter
MIGRALARAYIITEVVFALLFIVATSAATHFFGFEGASLGYAVTYVIYLPTVYVIFNRYANAVPSSASAGDKVGDLA